MNTTRFGRTGLEITRIGFGSWAIGGGDWEAGWGPQDEGDAIAAIRKATELGVNWIDTAAVYGLGRSEQLVGEAVRGLSPRPLVFTKCSMVWDEHRKIHRSLKRGSVRRECEASLKRLGLPCIDLYQIHWPNPENEIEEGWQEMARLKAEGLVRHIGVSNFTVAQIERVSRIAPVESVQPPYSLLRRDIEQELLPYCKAHDIGVIVYSPMQSGLLTGTMTHERFANLPSDDWRRGSPRFQEPNFSRALRIVDELRPVAQRHGVSVGEIAVAWTLQQPGVTAAIVGGRSAEQVVGTVGAAAVRLNDQDIRDIEHATASA